MVRLISKFAAVICLLLTISSSFAAASHSHSSPTESLTCQVCVLAHSTVPAVIRSTPKPTFLQVAAVTLPVLRSRQRVIPFALTVRPPPSV
jgi:hypothetical protein